MHRRAIFFRLKPGARDEYVRRHDAIWPAMREALTEAGFRNYSIWNHGDMLFAYYEVDDEERMAGVLAASAVFAEWRAWMEELVYLEPGTGRKEWPMEMVFYHAGE